MTTDYRNFKPRHLKELSNSNVADERLAAIREIERRKREMPDGSHGVWLTRRNAILGATVTAIVATVTLLVTEGPKVLEKIEQSRQQVHSDRPTKSGNQKAQTTDTVASLVPANPISTGPKATSETQKITSETDQEAHPRKPSEEAQNRVEKTDNRSVPAVEVNFQPVTSPVDTPGPSDQPIMLESIPIGKDNLSFSDAKAIASDARTTSDEILKCLPMHPASTDFSCMYLYGVQVFMIQDKLHDHTVELTALNDVVTKLRTHASSSEIRRSAEILAAIADQIDRTLTNPATAQASEVQDQLIVVEPTFIAGVDFNVADAQSTASFAQDFASRALSCLAQFKEPDGGYCINRYGSDIASARDHLRKEGIEFKSLEDALQKLNSQPSASALRYSARVLRSAADKVFDIARSDSNSSGGLTFGNIRIELPDTSHIRQGKLRSISKGAELTASEIVACLAEFKNAGPCAASTVFEASGHGSVVQEVNGIRKKLGEGGVVVDRLEDSAKRLGNGPSLADLRYIASVLDELSKQLDARTR
jgi:hypothetical protein